MKNFPLKKVKCILPYRKQGWPIEDNAYGDIWVTFKMAEKMKKKNTYNNVKNSKLPYFSGTYTWTAKKGKKKNKPDSTTRNIIAAHGREEKISTREKKDTLFLSKKIKALEYKLKKLENKVKSYLLVLKFLKGRRTRRLKR